MLQIRRDPLSHLLALRCHANRWSMTEELAAIVKEKDADATYLSGLSDEKTTAYVCE